jgi:hypothetical protein
MRFAIILSLFLSGASFGQGRFDRFNQRTDQGRSHRGFEQSSGAFFEFAPASGAGLGTACAGTNITGAKGEVLTLTRSGTATCLKQGLAATGIADADLVTVLADRPRVESYLGVLALRSEGARTNVLTRFIEPNNAAWADVGTPTPTTGLTSPWADTYVTSAVQYDDNDGAAFEGRTQTVTVTAATAYTMHCFVKAGTLASATLSLDGTTASITGLSTSTWSIVEVVDASSSGVAIAAQILNGSTAAATGTVIWGGCQVEAGTYRTSIQPTVAVAATRNRETPNLSGVSIAALASTGCARAYVARAAATTNGTAVSFSDSGGRPLYFTAGNQTAFDGTNNPNRATTFDSTWKWYITRWSGSSFVLGNSDNTFATTAFDGAMGVTGPLQVGDSTTNLNVDGLISRIQVDPDPTRCAP